MTPACGYTFDASLVGPILNGTRTCTVRLNDEREVTSGDIIEAHVDGINGVFARLRVTGTFDGRLADAYRGIEMFYGQHAAEDQADLERILAEHHPEDALDDDTPTRVIRFERIGTDGTKSNPGP